MENLFNKRTNVAVIHESQVDPGEGSWPDIDESVPFTGTINGGIYGLFVRVHDSIIDLNTFERLWNKQEMPQLQVDNVEYRYLKILVDPDDEPDTQLELNLV